MNPDPKINRVIGSVIDLLHEKRESLGVSKKRLAELSGVTRTAILLMERHDRSPSLELLLRIARALEVSMADIIREAEKRSNK